jgi:exopolysaccharide biosynthesis WecB/TagA/CpsF family protein
MTRKIDFLGLRFDDLDAAAAADTIARRSPDEPFAYVVTPNAHNIVCLWRDDRHWRESFREAWMTTCDGHVVQPLSRLLLGIGLPHASGSDITMLLIQNHIDPGEAITVIGGPPEMAEGLRRLYGWRNLTVHEPPFGLADNDQALEACIDFMEGHPARYYFMAIGGPAAQRLACLAARRGTLKGVALCIGGSLLFATGLTKRAPNWIRKLGMEGIFRLVHHPRTHFRRVFVDSLPVVWLLLLARLRGERIMP